MFNITVFVPILTAEAVMFCNDDEPCTTKLELTKREPVITCVPVNVLSPLNLAYVVAALALLAVIVAKLAENDVAALPL